MSPALLLDTYQTLSQTTGRMLDAAREGDWERLASLEGDCTRITGELQRMENDEPLPEDVRQAKIRLIRKVLADDAAIRDITEPWLARLDQMLRSTRQQRGLLQAYGPPSA